LMSSIAHLNPLNAMMTTVTLSRLHQFRAFFMMHSTPTPRVSCTSGFSFDLTVFQT